MMRVKSVGLIWLPALLFVSLLCATGAPAQEARPRPSRRVTNPARPQPAVPLPSPAPAARTRTPTDAEVISSAEDQRDAEEMPRPARRTTRAARRAAEDGETDDASLRRTVNILATQVRTLTESMGEMRDQQRSISDGQRTLVDLERLSRAEQRAEGFRAQLRDVMEKLIEFEARSEQLEFDLRPESIERRAALTGTMNPSTLREEIRRQIENEKRRVQQQMELLNTSRTRLEAAVISADLEVERLRRRMEENEQREAEAGAARTTRNSTARPATQTTTEQPENIPR